MKLSPLLLRISIFLCFFHCAICSSEEPNTQFESWSSGAHFYHPDFDSETPQIVSELAKDEITYQYVVSGSESGIIRKLLPDSSHEELYFIEEGRSFSPYSTALTYLIDVYESQDELAVLVLSAQTYVLMKAVKDYQAPPIGMYSLDLPLEAEQNWKPVYWAAFVPDGLFMSDLHGSAGKKLQNVELTSTSRVKFTFKAKDAEEDIQVNVYTFSGTEVKKNDIIIEETFYGDRADGDGYPIYTAARSDLFATEEEILNELEAMPDKILLEDLEPFLVADAIGPDLLEIFSSFSNQTRVEALRNRIEGLL